MRALDGWRGFTALLVVLFHLLVAYSLFFQEWLRSLAPVLEFFFIVSGFVMAASYGRKVKDRATFWGFVVRRLGRVAPLHWFMMSLLLLIPLLRFVLGTPGELFSGRLSLEALPAQILMLQTWWPDYAFTWNYPAWTLSGEVVAYLIMGLILLVAVGPRTRWGLTLLVLMVSASFLLIQLLAVAGQVNVNITTISRAVTGYFIGFLLHDVMRWFPLRSRFWAHVLEVVAAAGFVAALNFHLSGPAYFLYHALFALLVYVFAHDMGFVSRIMSMPPLLWLGKVSFSIYMFHGIVNEWLILVAVALEARGFGDLTSVVMTPHGQPAHVLMLSEQWMNDAVALGYLAVVLIGGAYIHRFVEDPSRRYFAKLGDKVAARASTAPAALPQTRAGLESA